MRYLAAYLLCQLGGSPNPTEADIKNVLNSVGIEHDSERLSKLLSSLHGKNTEQLIAAGYAKMVSIPTGGAAAAPAPQAKAAEPAAAAKKEPVKETKKESEPEESDEDMGLGLFD